MTLRVLLAESDTEDVLFLRDVLEEMEGSEYWSGWLHLDTFDAPTWSFADAILATEPIDVILLSLNLSDVQGTEAFRKAHAAAPHVPVILLINEEDVDTAERLVRDGAQDFLIKKHVDCEPLAHALRNAVERHRLLSAARAASMIDPLTGLLNRAAFQLLADRDRRVAERNSTRMAVLVVRPKNLAGLASAYGDQQRDLTLVEAADQLRAVAGPIDAVARITEDRFAVSLVETRAESVETAVARFELSRAPLDIGVAIFDPAHPEMLDALLTRAEVEITRPEAPPLTKRASGTARAS